MLFGRPSYSLRAALLGAVALAALGGVAVETSIAPVSAEATSAQVPAGPASFADVVDRVKPAVVSVKVKLTDADPVDDEDFDGIPGMPDIPKNSPFYHFFRHFGMPDNNDGADRGDRARAIISLRRRAPVSSFRPTATSSPMTMLSTTPRKSR